MNGGLLKKLSDNGFKDIILNHDLILLTECWIDKDFSADIPNFSVIPYPRKLTKCTQGGGSVIIVRDTYLKYITVIHNYADTVIWLKLDHALTAFNQDLYIACTYLPPSTSSFHRHYDVDIFYDLENQIHHYSSLGKVILIGDMNARTSVRPDYIETDNLHGDLTQLLAPLLNYYSDVPLCPRINPDPTVNDFGFKLLTLCKSSGLRILNGRHPDGNSNDFTFAGSRGLSVVDYIVTTPDIFPYVKSFEVADFNIFSDHAPLYSVLQCKTIPVKKKDAIPHSYSSLRTFKWSDDNLHIAREALLVNMDELNHTLDNLTDDSAQNSIDDSINRFSSVLTNIMSPFFEVKNSNDPRSNSFPSSASTHSYRVQPSVPHVDKPWFTDELKNLHRTYLTALRTFNSDKSVFNHERLRSTKKAYKSLEGRLKRQFQRVEGDMLQNLRKSNPKAFFKRFAKRRVSCKKGAVTCVS